MNTLTIYREGSPVITVDIDDKTVFIQKIMTEHRIASEFYSRSVLDLRIGDYITHNLENFYVNRLPSITKLDNATFQYRVDFESVLYDLNKKLFISTDGLAEYGRTGNASDFIGDIVANMNASGFAGGWTVGTVDSTDEKTLVFSNENCRSALMKVAEAFGLEFSIANKSISMVDSVGSITANTFEYGRNNGLYRLVREQVADQNIVTKVYGFGSSMNIPYTYRNRAKRLVFEERYLTKNTEIYGVIEGQYTNDDIYPNRTGSVTAVNMEFEGDVFNVRDSYIEDSAITGFDINDYVIAGLDPLIVFKSGDLSGQEFVIWKFDNATKRIHFNPQSDEDGYTTPNPLNVPQVGDLYTLVNIALPESYIADAELALKNATQAYLDENSVPMVVYSVEIDPKYAKANAMTLHAGDRVTVVDTQLGVDSLIRISEITYPLTNIYKVKATIADFVPYTQQERIVKAAVSNITETRIVDRSGDELTRRYTMRQRQLKDLIFDTDGYFDVTNIRPLSIETQHLAVGVGSQNFHLNGVRIMANYLGDPNRIYVSTGQLVHHEFEIEGLGYEWVIGSALDQSGLDPDTAYYLYARCETDALTGTWVLSASHIKYNDEPGYYNFLCGILYTVIDGVRDFDFTYGMTYINGRTITTGRIQTVNEINYIDLDTNAFNLGGTDAGIDWNVTAAGVLTIRGAVVQRAVGETFPIVVFRGAYNPVTVYHNGDEVMYNSVMWLYHNNTPAAGMPVIEGDFWTQVGTSVAATQSPIPVFRGQWSAGVDYYGTTSRTDIVYYPDTGLYYIARTTAGDPFRDVLPTDTDYWSSFGASFSSVATEILFAEFGVIENAAIRYFRGVPVTLGSLDGSVVHTQAAVAGTNRIDRILMMGSSGSALISVDGHTQTINYYGVSIEETCMHFVELFADGWLADYGIEVTSFSDFLYFEFTWGEDATEAASVTPISGTLSGEVDDPVYQAYVSGTKQIDTITLTGEGGTAAIRCNMVIRRATYRTDREVTASDFVTLWGGEYDAENVVLAASGENIVCTSKYKGYSFTLDTDIWNVATLHRGGIDIDGNDIYESHENNDNYGVVRINYRGHNGGGDYYRHTIIGTGRNESLAIFSPISNTGGAKAGITLRYGGFGFPAMTTAARNAYNFSIGTVIYNSELQQLQIRKASGWFNIVTIGA